MSQDSPRTLDQITEILHMAKLTEDDIMPRSQTIYFANHNVNENNYKLLQLDPYLLTEVKEGRTLYIKGTGDEDIVLCSETKTYNVTEAETSNSLLLVDGLQFPNEIKQETERSINTVRVHGIFYNYLEAVAAKPHLKKISELLADSVYKGPEYEYEVENKKLYTLDDLIDVIQASKKEIEDALASMAIVKVNNKIRLLDFDYHFQVLSLMLNLIDENSWQLDEIDYDETMNALKDLVPFEVLNHLFDKYTEETKIVDGLQLYRYKEAEVCKISAQLILKSAGRINLEDFLKTWKLSVPEGMIPNEEMLYGIAIIDRKSNPNVVRPFDEESLPENIIQRLNKLFEVKEKWSVPEITPYIKRLATDKMDTNALLAKYARASKVNDVKYYSSKHGK